MDDRRNTSLKTILVVGFICIAFAMLLVVVIVMTEHPIAQNSSQTNFDSDLVINPELFESVSKADEATLYEGLPHPHEERRQFEQELRRTDKIELCGYPFYSSPLDLAPGEKEKLQGIFSRAASFAQWHGHKLCGGFHPDYAVEWTSNGQTVRFLICFGCDEARVCGHNYDLIYDLAPGDAKNELLNALSKYRKNRPPFEIP